MLAIGVRAGRGFDAVAPPPPLKKTKQNGGKSDLATREISFNVFYVLI